MLKIQKIVTKILIGIMSTFILLIKKIKTRMSKCKNQGGKENDNITQFKCNECTQTNESVK